MIIVTSAGEVNPAEQEDISMGKNIVVLNGSPRSKGNTSALVREFTRGAEEAGHTVTEFFLDGMDIHGCKGCFGGHSGRDCPCVQRDDMQEVYPLLDEAEMIVLASPIYYHNFTGQLQCAISRIYALDKPKKLKKAALLLSSGSDHVYSGAIFEYQNSFLNDLHLEDMGIFSAYDRQNKSPEKLEELREFGRSL